MTPIGDPASESPDEGVSVKPELELIKDSPEIKEAIQVHKVVSDIRDLANLLNDFIRSDRKSFRLTKREAAVLRNILNHAGDVSAELYEQYRLSTNREAGDTP